ncbi:MAG: sugar phosphate isomerase/epimerase [Balneolaceae bacterium]|nr:sugar phosphate isomerase/epimerase [Balneolaceae bacterium]MDR9408997.1 sugar phosphate isomerase/epimerase [Balneolaceae bacterium]
MELAIHNWMRAEPIETTIERIARLGYHKLEIAGEPGSYDTQKIGKLLKDHGIGCWGSVTLMMEERNLLAADEDQRAMSIQYVKDVVKMVKELNGTMVSVVPGTVGKLVPDGRPEEEWEWAVSSMKEIYDYAESQEILIGIEPINRFETYFINRGDQALALAKEVGPNCGVCLDVFHMNIEEDDTYDAILRAKGRINGIHVADNNRMAPGMGKLNWPKIVDTVKEAGFDGAISVEFCSPVDRTPANPYINSIDEKPEGLSAEQKKFIEDHGSTSVSEEFYTELTRRSAEKLLPLING